MNNTANNSTKQILLELEMLACLVANKDKKNNAVELLQQLKKAEQNQQKLVSLQNKHVLKTEVKQSSQSSKAEQENKTCHQPLSRNRGRR